MGEQDGDVGDEGEQPGESYQPPHIPYSPGGQGRHRVDHGQVPVPSHQYEGVDGDVGRDVDDVLDRPAPGQTEGPEHQDVVTGCGRDTDLRQGIYHICTYIV